MECKICKKESNNEDVCAKCKRYYSLQRKCKVCDCLICNKNKTDYCNKHRSRSGENNSMHGRSVFDVWVKKFGIEEAQKRQEIRNLKTKESLEKLWKNKEYRDKVIASVTGRKRSQEFKDDARRRAVEQMKDPKQLEIRSKALSNSWDKGLVTADHTNSNLYGKRGFHEGIFYASKVELERIKKLIESGIEWKRYVVNDFNWRIEYIYKERKHLYLPDFVIHYESSIIIEEVKYDIKRISDFERAKIIAAMNFFSQKEIRYRVIDDPNSDISPANIGYNILN